MTTTDLRHNKSKESGDMYSTTRKKWTGLAVAAAASLTLAGGASAASLTDAFHILDNGSASQFFTANDLSTAEYYDVGSGNDGVVGIGDVILGTLALDELISGPNSVQLTNVTAAFALQVVGMSGNTALFGSVTDVAFTGLVGSVLGGFDAAIFEGGVATNPNVNPPVGSFGVGTAYTDGDIFAQLSALNYSINFASTNLAALSAITPGTTIASLGFGSGFLVTGDGSIDGGSAIGEVLNIVPNGLFGFDIGVAGTISPSGNTLVFHDTADFNMQGDVIPSPMAAGVGLFGMFGLAFCRRKAAAA